MEGQDWTNGKGISDGTGQARPGEDCCWPGWAVVVRISAIGVLGASFPSSLRKMSYRDKPATAHGTKEQIPRFMGCGSLLFMEQAADQFSCCWGGWKHGCLELIRRGRVIRKKPRDPRKAEERTRTEKEHIVSKESSTTFPSHWIVGTLLFQGITMLFSAFLLFNLSQAVSGDYQQSVSSSI